MGGGEREMERGVGRERGRKGRVRDKEMDGETDRDEWLSRRVDQHMMHCLSVCLFACLPACLSVCLSACHQVSLHQLYLLSINFCIQKSIPNEVHSPPLSTSFSEDQLVASTVGGGRGGGGGEGGEGGGKDTCHVSCVGSRYNQLLPVHSGHSQHNMCTV